MINLTDQQGSAVSKIGKWFKTFEYGSSLPYFEFQGVAGSGKSSILPFIIDAVGLNPSDIAFVAPTGKAARVMSVKMKQMGVNAKARTIHSAFYLPNTHKVKVLEAQLNELMTAADELTVGSVHPNYAHLTLERARAKIQEDIQYLGNELEAAYDLGITPKFSLNLMTEARYAKLIVVDEASMVGKKIADELLSFNVPILAIGDHFQLPPVEDKPGFLTRKPQAALTEIHRQAEGNPILWLSKLIREGKDLPMGRHGDGVKVVSKRDDDATYDVDRDCMIICGTHRKKWTITNKLRKAAGFECEGPQQGEPLIIKRNSTKIDGWFNGEFVESLVDVQKMEHGRAQLGVKVRMEDGKEHYVQAWQALFERFKLKDKNGSTADRKQSFKAAGMCEHLEFGHAITCHSSQGSQWDEVALHDESGVFGQDASRWLYVGVTRAAERLTVVV